MAAAKTAAPAAPAAEGAPPDAAAQPDPATVDGPICGVDWPDGWPAGTDMTSCEHGIWTRTS